MPRTQFSCPDDVDNCVMPSNMYTERRSREMYTRRKMYTERRSREKLRVMRSRELSGCSQLAAVQSGVMVVAPFTASTLDLRQVGLPIALN